MSFASSLTRATMLGAAICALCQCCASLEQLKKRASFDFACNEDQLAVLEIDGRTRGVRGCGKSATYVESCKPCANGNQSCDCTWILNSLVKPE